MILKKPKKLVPGDTVALISPSAGLAGEKDILYRTNMGIELSLIHISEPTRRS